MSHQTQRDRIIQNLLPWAIAGVFLLLYLFTLGRGITLANLNVMTDLSGWNWPQNSLPPVTFLLTSPLRWLSPSGMALGLDLISAVCGALTLGLLARAVVLLPHDRTESQRLRERSEFSQLTISTSWLPPVLAVLTCGLQLTFWRSSVDGSMQILDGLLFIYPVRCLLEYRIDGRQTWLTKAILVFGLGMANHWLMALMLPFFLLALLWIKGVSFFNPGFLLTVFMSGLAGLAVCLLKPLMASLGAGAPLTLSEAMQAYFVGQKNVLLFVPYRTLWVLGLTSLLPVAILGIRWASSFGDSSPMGAALASFMFHVVHGVFLVICLWGAFDSPLSPWAYSHQAVDLHPFYAGQPWLPLYLLAGLSVGYYSGYFLLVFNNQVQAARQESDLGRKLNALFTFLIGFCLLAVPIGLMGKNLSSIRATGSKSLADYGRHMIENLPNKNAVLISDDARLLALAEAILQPTGGERNYLFLNTASLNQPKYHEYLHKRFPRFWSDELSGQARTNQIPPVDLIKAVIGQAATHELYYLHPSFGYYFEHFYSEPRGLVYRLQPYPTNALLAPLVSPEQIEMNQTFWKRLDEYSLPMVIRGLPQDKSNTGMLGKILSRMKARIEPDDQTMLVGAYYSRALNNWGVAQQTQGNLTDAAWCFKRAVDLNPLNVVAAINAACNETLQAGAYEPVDLKKTGLAEKLNQYRDPAQLLAINGPFDEPRFCYDEGTYFTMAAHYRQAARLLHRAIQLNPSGLPAYNWLAQIYNLWQQPDQALELVRKAQTLSAATTNNPTDLAITEAIAYFTKKDGDAAVQVLQAVLRDRPDDRRLENAVISLLMNFQRQEVAMQIVDRRLQQSPNDPDALNNKGALYLQLNQFAKAIPPLDRLLELQPENYTAKLNRAIALLQSDRLDESRRDYETLAAAFPTTYQLYYGLGEIAYRQQHTAEAISYYELYLKYAPASTDEARKVQKRLEELKSSPR